MDNTTTQDLFDILVSQDVNTGNLTIAINGSPDFIDLTDEKDLNLIQVAIKQTVNNVMTKARKNLEALNSNKGGNTNG